MDPLFFAHLAQQAQQRLHIIAKGKQAESEAELLNQRREMLASAQQSIIQLVQESSSNPKRTYVLLLLLGTNLEESGVVPDSFKDQQEKEDVVLLWRKFISLHDKCRSYLTADQLVQCQECLEAIGMQVYIETIARRLQAYQEYQQLKPIWNRTRRNTKIAALLGSAFMALILSIMMVVIVSLSSTPKYGVNVKIMVGLITFLVVFFMLFLFGNFDYSESIDQRYHQLSEDAHLEDQAYWQEVKDKYEGIPTMEQLEHSWDEQSAKISLIFGEPLTSPSSAQSAAFPSDR